MTRPHHKTNLKQEIYWREMQNCSCLWVGTERTLGCWKGLAALGSLKHTQWAGRNKCTGQLEVLLGLSHGCRGFQVLGSETGQGQSDFQLACYSKFLPYLFSVGNQSGIRKEGNINLRIRWVVCGWRSPWGKLDLHHQLLSGVIGLWFHGQGLIIL